jgi:hypothetical protein
MYKGTLRNQGAKVNVIQNQFNGGDRSSYQHPHNILAINELPMINAQSENNAQTKECFYYRYEKLQRNDNDAIDTLVTACLKLNKSDYIRNSQWLNGNCFR